MGEQIRCGKRVPSAGWARADATWWRWSSALWRWWALRRVKETSPRLSPRPKTLPAARSLQKAKLYSDEAQGNHLQAAKSMELVTLLSEEEAIDGNRLQEKIREAHILRQQARQKMRAMGDSIPDSLQPGSMLNFGESVGRHPSSVVQAIQATHPHLERSIARSEKAEAEEKEKDDKVKAKQEEK